MVNFTLHYFNGRGRAEISRLIFAHAGVAFNDNRIEDWPKTKPETPIGQLPFLTINNDENNNSSDITQLPQSLSIARYLAKEYNLTGKDNLEAAKADAIVDTCIDLMTAFYYKVFLVTEKNEKEKALRKFLVDDALKGLESIEKLIKLYGKNGFSVGNQLTWSDLFIYEMTYSFLNYQKDLLDKFHLLKKIRSLVEENENVSNYLKNRTLTPY